MEHDHEHINGEPRDHPRIISRAELDTMFCSVPDCHTIHGPLRLGVNCHPGQGLEMEYEAGLIHVSCHACGTHSVWIEVAEHAPSLPNPQAGGDTLDP